jgi:hypothetical protein
MLTIDTHIAIQQLEDEREDIECGFFHRYFDFERKKGFRPKARTCISLKE